MEQSTSASGSSVVLAEDAKGMENYNILRNYKSLLNYIGSHSDKKVVHLYYGPKMMRAVRWKVTPYHIQNETLLKQLHALTLVYFHKKMHFVLYNGTTRKLDFAHLNISVIPI